MSFHHLLNETIKLSNAGNPLFYGTLIAIESDLIVVKSKNRYFYVPLKHIKSMKKYSTPRISEESDYQNQAVSSFSFPPVSFQTTRNSMNLHMTLQNSKNSFIELKLVKESTLIGKIISVHDDFCTFWDLAEQKIIIIVTDHIKWLSPVNELVLRSVLKLDQFNTVAKLDSSITNLAAFLQLKKGQLVEIDNEHIGIIETVCDDWIELKSILNSSLFLPQSHIKWVKCIN